jgi:hypothetical protein
MVQSDVIMIFRETSPSFPWAMEQKNMASPLAGGFSVDVALFFVVLIHFEDFIPRDSLHFCQTII